MKRYVWIGLCSVLVHLALFWPGPDRTRDGKLPALVVNLPDSTAPSGSEGMPPSVRPAPINPSAQARRDGIPPKAAGSRAADRVETQALPARSEAGRRDVPVHTESAPSGPVDRERLQASVGTPGGQFAWARYRIALASAAVMRVHTALLPHALPDEASTVTVEVRGLQGGPTTVRVVGSSGYSGLDETVLRALERALGDIPPPRPEQDAEWAFRLPVLVARASEE